MIPIKNKKKNLEATVEEMRNFAFAYIEKYAPSKQQLKTYLLKKYLKTSATNIKKNDINDLISIVLVVATQAKGSVLIHQKMFESRLFFVDKLIDMGAKIILCDPHRAIVIGHEFKSNLKATKMTSPDIRAGVSLLIAALSAEGTSTIHNIEQIDRGYENIDDRLNAIGASIERFK